MIASPDHLNGFKNVSVSALLRLLLTSDGTLIDHLLALSMQPIHFELLSQEETSIDAVDLMDWPDLAPGCKGIERRVWLRVDQPPIAIFACSFFPLEGLPPWVHREMLSLQLPLGKILQHLPIRRHRIRIRRETVPVMSAQMGCSPEELFWVRRYRLTLPDGYTGAIFEAFPPQF